jgi:hypothetical protein
VGRGSQWVWNRIALGGDGIDGAGNFTHQIADALVVFSLSLPDNLAQATPTDDLWSDRPIGSASIARAIVVERPKFDALQLLEVPRVGPCALRLQNLTQDDQLEFFEALSEAHRPETLALEHLDQLPHGAGGIVKASVAQSNALRPELDDQRTVAKAFPKILVKLRDLLANFLGEPRPPIRAPQDAAQPRGQPHQSIDGAFAV